ncbi:MAG: hypothetical protein RTV72_10475 [Candidatus Thorarchaeota archaeon]
MVIDHSTPNHDNMKSRLYDTVALGKVSSLEMISSITGIEEELVREAIEELVQEGTLQGLFTADGKRFFLSNVKTSAAPIVDSLDQGLEMKRADTKLAKGVGLGGFLMLIIGQILRSLVEIHTGLEAAGTAIFMLGLGLLIAGWYQYSRLEPPAKIQ